MSFDGAGSLPALARMAEIRSRFSPPRPGVLGAVPASTTGGATLVTPSSEGFADALARAKAAAPAPSTLPAAATAAPAPATSGGSAVLTDTTPYAELFRAAGAAHGIDPALLAAVAKVESGFDPTAQSPAGAEGLMQFMPGTSAGMGVDPWDPDSAVDGAARLLRSHLDRFGSHELALAAYNAGAGNVNRYGGVPPFAETRAYVAKVLALAPQGTTL